MQGYYCQALQLRSPQPVLRQISECAGITCRILSEVQRLEDFALYCALAVPTGS